MALSVTMNWVLYSIVFVVPVLYQLSSTFRFYTKLCIYYVLMNIAAIFVIILSLGRPFDVRNYSYAKSVVSEARHLFGIDLNVKGRENLEGEEPCVVVANHQTSLDFFGMMEVWPSRCTALSKRSLQYMLPFGLAATLVGTVFVDRGNKAKALDTMSSAAESIRNNKTKIFIFPEGTRNHDGGMRLFKKGAFHLAVQTQVPIAPVVFSSYNNFYNKKEKRFETGKMVIMCMPKISTVGLTEEDVPALAERVREEMLAVFNQMNSELFPQAEQKQH